MKKILAFLLVVAMVGCMFAGCNPSDNGGNKGFDYNAISDDCKSEDGKYEIAFITDVGDLKDKSFNQGTWEGVKRYASENGKTYKYYQPANRTDATDDDRFNAMDAAVKNGAKLVVCAGFLQENALRRAAIAYPDVSFVFIDGYPIRQDKEDENSAILTNVAGISFQEEQSGYLAGYAAVMEGYTKLGYAGGGGGSNPACCRFGYGYVQGAQAAAAEKNVNVEMRYSFEYGSAFSASPELQTMLDGWYTNGTEVVFCCGGSMCQSAFAAAAANDGAVIGVDVDQSNQSPTVITSATKGLRESVMIVCKTFYDGKFSTLGGVSTAYGAKDDAVGLPTDTWSLKNFTVDQYNALFAKLKNGEITVDSDYSKLETNTYANVKLSVE